MEFKFDIYNLDADMQGSLVTTVQKERISTDEAIARAHDWLREKDFLVFMNYWKIYDYAPIVYANLDDEEDFLVAIERDCFETVITVFRR